MSDRKNRDIGKKRTHQSLYWCDCWRCTDGKTKKRLLTERKNRKDAMYASTDAMSVVGEARGMSSGDDLE